jgi:hypothetical protein
MLRATYMIHRVTIQKITILKIPAMKTSKLVSASYFPIQSGYRWYGYAKCKDF